MKEQKIEFSLVDSEDDLAVIVKVLNRSHGTVAEEFGFTKETNPSNNAFIDKETLRKQLQHGIKLYQISVNENAIGCIAIEKSANEIDTFYIEKLSVIPEYRHKGHGTTLMEFAAAQIIKSRGKTVSIALIDSNTRLKKWYSGLGFKETGVKEFSHLPFQVCFMSKEV